MFLMGVEIERLLVENDSLKSELKNAQSHDLDRLNYEVQIADLMEQIEDLHKYN